MRTELVNPKIFALENSRADASAELVGIAGQESTRCEDCNLSPRTSVEDRHFHILTLEDDNSSSF